MNRKFLYIGILVLCGVGIFFFAKVLSRDGFTREYHENELGETVRDELETTVSNRKSFSPPYLPPLVRLLSRNVFDPLRGKKKPSDEEPAILLVRKETSFKLHGIFDYNNEKGALIIGPDKKSKRVFKLNDSLGNGYFIREIRPNEVVISGGGSEITLKLEKKAQASSGAPKQPETLKTSQQPGRSY